MSERRYAEDILSEIAANSREIRDELKHIKAVIYDKSIESCFKNQRACNHMYGMDKDNKVIYDGDPSFKNRTFILFEYCPRCGVKR